MINRRRRPHFIHGIDQSDVMVKLQIQFPPLSNGIQLQASWLGRVRLRYQTIVHLSVCVWGVLSCWIDFIVHTRMKIYWGRDKPLMSF